MTDTSTMFKRYLNYIITILAILGIGYGISSQKAIFAGLILGTLGSLFILWTLSRTAFKLGEATKSGKSFFTLGTLPRFVIAALVAWVGLSYPQNFNIIGIIIGLTMSYIIILLDFTVSIFRKGQNHKER